MPTAMPCDPSAPLLSPAQQAAQVLAQAVAGRSRELEQARRLPPDLVQALADHGLLRMLTPRVYGGAELPVAEFFAVVERLARADAALAWCTFISCTASLVAAWLPPATAQTLFADPKLKVAGVFAPRGQARPEQRNGVDGFNVSGRWFWGSGAAHADLISAGCLVLDAQGQPQKMPDGSPRVLSVLLPRAQVQVIDNWDAVGLCATGSGEFVVEQAFVPASHCVSLFDAPQINQPLYQFPVFGLLALSIAAVSSGVARLALDSFIASASDKTLQGASRAQAQRATVHDALARAEAQWRAARAGMLDAIHSAWAAAQQGSLLGLQERLGLRLAASHCAHTAVAITQRMLSLSGGDAVLHQSSQQRCWRDAQVAAQHLMVGEASFELAGRVLLGQAAVLATL